MECCSFSHDLLGTSSQLEDKLDDKISFTRILKFQAQGLGYTLLLSLPVLGLAVLASSQELTDWTSSAVPIYAREAYLAATFSLMIGGLAVFAVCMESMEVGPMLPWLGTRMALRVVLPWTAVSSTVLLATVLGVSWAGVDVHFYHADVVAFVVVVVVIILGGAVLSVKFGPVINPTKYLNSGGSMAETKEGKEASDADDGGLIEFLLMVASVISVIVACKYYSTRTLRKANSTH